MSQPPSQLDDLVKGFAESHRQVRFGTGVVGKTSHCTIALLGAWAVVLFRISGNPWQDVPLLLGAALVTGAYIWWVRSTQRFAKENPGLALLEGTELLEYQKFEAQAKGLLPGPTSPLIPDPSAPKSITVKVVGPDEEAQQ